MKRLFGQIKRWVIYKLNKPWPDHSRRAFYGPRDVNRLKFQSGRWMRVKTVMTFYYSDPRDMIQEQQYEFLGFEGEKPFREMGLIEFIKYCNKN